MQLFCPELLNNTLHWLERKSFFKVILVICLVKDIVVDYGGNWEVSCCKDAANIRFMRAYPPPSDESRPALSSALPCFIKHYSARDQIRRQSFPPELFPIPLPLTLSINFSSLSTFCFSICYRCFWYTKRSGVVPSDRPVLIAQQDARKPHILEQRHHHACRDNTHELLTGRRTPSPSCRGASPSSPR